MTKDYKELARQKGAEFFERFQERAGIIEFDGGFTSWEADKLAYEFLIGSNL